jgi:8-oxo-dGTP pyrophosphatase MutT (NUDIX family)
VDGHQRALVDVRIAVCQEGTVLMLQRCDNLFPGYWNLPGGHALPGEDALTGEALRMINSSQRFSTYSLDGVNPE